MLMPVTVRVAVSWAARSHSGKKIWTTGWLNIRSTVISGTTMSIPRSRTQNSSIFSGIISISITAAFWEWPSSIPVFPVIFIPYWKKLAWEIYRDPYDLDSMPVNVSWREFISTLHRLSDAIFDCLIKEIAVTKVSIALA